MTTPARQPHKANDPATLRCDNEPCLFHHLGICRFSCHAWQPCATHTSPPAPEQHITGDDVRKHKEDWFNVGYTEGAKAAREQFASELIEKIEKYLDEREQPKCVVISLQMVEKLIKKSLRAQQAGEP